MEFFYENDGLRLLIGIFVFAIIFFVVNFFMKKKNTNNSVKSMSFSQWILQISAGLIVSIASYLFISQLNSRKQTEKCALEDELTSRIEEINYTQSNYEVGIDDTYILNAYKEVFEGYSKLNDVCSGEIYATEKIEEELKDSKRFINKYTN